MLEIYSVALVIECEYYLVVVCVKVGLTFFQLLLLTCPGDKDVSKLSLPEE